MDKEMLSRLNKDKIKIRFNKNPIKMELFLSFLIIETKRSTDFLGVDTGWTQLTGEDLILTGGRVGNIEYLDSIQYKENLDNPYNNYVNPFFLFDILSYEGKEFFVEYYKDDMDNLLRESKVRVESAKHKLKYEELENEHLISFLSQIKANLREVKK